MPKQATPAAPRAPRLFLKPAQAAEFDDTALYEESAASRETPNGTNSAPAGAPPPNALPVPPPIGEPANPIGTGGPMVDLGGKAYLDPTLGTTEPLGADESGLRDLLGGGGEPAQKSPPAPRSDALIDHGAGTSGGAPPARDPELPKFTRGEKTSGVLRTAAGDIPLLSGRAGPAASLTKPTAGFNAITSTHVEGHAAAMMRQQGIDHATLYINNPEICLPCKQNLANMLPSGSKLTIVLPDGTSTTYIGNAR
jgi:hypothetical protein